MALQTQGIILLTQGLNKVLNTGSYPYFSIKYFVPIYDERTDVNIHTPPYTDSLSAVNNSLSEPSSAVSNYLPSHVNGEILYSLPDGLEYELSESQRIVYTESPIVGTVANTNQTSLDPKANTVTESGNTYTPIRGSGVIISSAGSVVTDSGAGVFNASSWSSLSQSPTLLSVTSTTAWDRDYLYDTVSYASQAQEGPDTGVYTVRLGKVGDFKFNKILLFVQKMNVDGTIDLTESPVPFAVVALDKIFIKTKTGNVNSYTHEVRMSFSRSSSAHEITYKADDNWFSIPMTTGVDGTSAVEYKGSVMIAPAISGVLESQPKAKLDIYDNTGNIPLLRIARAHSSQSSGAFLDINTTTSAVKLYHGDNDRIELGKTATVTMNHAVAGPSSSADGEYSIALGFNNRTKFTASTALGIATSALFTGSLSGGQYSKAAGSYAVALGNYVEANAGNSFVYGQRSKTFGLNSFAGGRDCYTFGSQSVALGYDTSAFGSHSLSHGYRSRNNGSAALSIGYYTSATGNYSAAINSYTLASGESSFVFGTLSSATGTASVAGGNASLASALASAAFGYRTRAVSNYATSFGFQSSATSFYAASFGLNTLADGTHSTVFGNNSKALGNASFAAGTRTLANAINSVAFGNRSSAYGDNSLVIGDYVYSDIDDSLIAGYKTNVVPYAAQRPSIGFGYEYKASVAYSMFGGSGTSGLTLSYSNIITRDMNDVSDTSITRDSFGVVTNSSAYDLTNSFVSGRIRDSFIEDSTILGILTGINDVNSVGQIDNSFIAGSIYFDTGSNIRRSFITGEKRLYSDISVNDTVLIGTPSGEYIHTSLNGCIINTDNTPISAHPSASIDYNIILGQDIAMGNTQTSTMGRQYNLLLGYRNKIGLGPFANRYLSDRAAGGAYKDRQNYTDMSFIYQHGEYNVANHAYHFQHGYGHTDDSVYIGTTFSNGVSANEKAIAYQFGYGSIVNNSFNAYSIGGRNKLTNVYDTQIIGGNSTGTFLSSGGFDGFWGYSLGNAVPNAWDNTKGNTAFDTYQSIILGEGNILYHTINGMIIGFNNSCAKDSTLQIAGTVVPDTGVILIGNGLNATPHIASTSTSRRAHDFVLTGSFNYRVPTEYMNFITNIAAATNGHFGFNFAIGNGVSSNDTRDALVIGWKHANGALLQILMLPTSASAMNDLSYTFGGIQSRLPTDADRTALVGNSSGALPNGCIYEYASGGRKYLCVV